MTTYDQQLELIREWVIDEYCSDRKFSFIFKPIDIEFRRAFCNKDLFEITTDDIWNASPTGELMFVYEWNLAAQWYFGMKYAGLKEPKVTMLNSLEHTISESV